jgi:hypothetical protein
LSWGHARDILAGLVGAVVTALRTNFRYGQALEGQAPSLAAQVDAELVARDVDRGPEPQLVAPRPDGPLSGIQPLLIVG